MSFISAPSKYIKHNDIRIQQQTDTETGQERMKIVGEGNRTHGRKTRLNQD